MKFLCDISHCIKKAHYTHLLKSLLGHVLASML